MDRRSHQSIEWELQCPCRANFSAGGRDFRVFVPISGGLPTRGARFPTHKCADLSAAALHADFQGNDSVPVQGRRAVVLSDQDCQKVLDAIFRRHAMQK